MENALEVIKNLAQERVKMQYPNVPDYAIPKSNYSDKSTNGLTKCIIDWINLNGFQAERINSTGRVINNTEIVTDTIGRSRRIGSIKWIKGNGQTGTADISATIKGRSVKVEVKCKATGDRYQSDAQKSYQKEIEAAGGVYVIARTFDGFMKWYFEFIKKY